MKNLTPPGPTDARLPAGERRLTAVEFQHLVAVPAAVEWFANIDNPRTRRAYQADLEGLRGSAEELLKLLQ